MFFQWLLFCWENLWFLFNSIVIVAPFDILAIYRQSSVKTPLKTLQVNTLLYVFIQKSPSSLHWLVSALKKLFLLQWILVLVYTAFYLWCLIQHWWSWCNFTGCYWQNLDHQTLVILLFSPRPFNFRVCLIVLYRPFSCVNTITILLLNQIENWGSKFRASKTCLKGLISTTILQVLKEQIKLT